MSQPRILVVDDHPETLRLISIILERKGFDVLTAASGEQGIKETRANHPDLILMDIMMPRMNGVEACIKLRHDSDPHVANSTIVMFSASSSKEDKDRATAAEADGYIVKPTMPSELLDIVNSYLANPRKAQAAEASSEADQTDETPVIGVIGEHADVVVAHLSTVSNAYTVIDLTTTADTPTLTHTIITIASSIPSIYAAQQQIAQYQADSTNNGQQHVVLVEMEGVSEIPAEMISQLLTHPIDAIFLIDANDPGKTAAQFQAFTDALHGEPAVS